MKYRIAAASLIILLITTAFYFLILMDIKTSNIEGDIIIRSASRTYYTSSYRTDSLGCIYFDTKRYRRLNEIEIKHIKICGQYEIINKKLNE